MTMTINLGDGYGNNCVLDSMSKGIDRDCDYGNDDKHDYNHDCH